MSEPKKLPRTITAEMDGLLQEIQRLEVEMMEANTKREALQERLKKLQKKRDALGGGQSLFMLEGDQ